MKGLNGSLDDYKPVLTLSAKPELLILLYLLANAGIALALLLYSAWVQISFLLLNIPLVWMLYQALKRYYFLQDKFSIKEVWFESDDNIKLRLGNQSMFLSARLVDSMRVNKTILLYFTIYTDTQFQCDHWYKKVVYQLRLFFNYNVLVFVVSENQANHKEFRGLLRHLHNMK